MGDWAESGAGDLNTSGAYQEILDVQEPGPIARLALSKIPNCRHGWVPIMLRRCLYLFPSKRWKMTPIEMAATKEEWNRELEKPEMTKKRK